MRILLDECIDQRFRKYFPDHDCRSAMFAGLTGLKNGLLLEQAERAGFDVLVTVDQGIEYQQNLRGRSVAILVLQPKSNRIRDLATLVPACLAALQSIQAGAVVRIEL